MINILALRPPKEREFLELFQQLEPSEQARLREFAKNQQAHKRGQCQCPTCNPPRMPMIRRAAR